MSEAEAKAKTRFVYSFVADAYERYRLKVFGTLAPTGAIWDDPMCREFERELELLFCAVNGN